MLVTQLRPRGQRGPEEPTGGRSPGRYQAPGGRHQDSRRDCASRRAHSLYVQQDIRKAGHGRDVAHSGVGPYWSSGSAPCVLSTRSVSMSRGALPEHHSSENSPRATPPCRPEESPTKDLGRGRPQPCQETTPFSSSMVQVATGMANCYENSQPFTAFRHSGGDRNPVP